MVNIPRPAWPKVTPILILLTAVSSCDQTRRQQPSITPQIEETAQSDAAPQPEKQPFALYSTLAGKMARMEELLNAVDRFLGDADFQNRLVTDAAEFHQLLVECRGLYPKELSPDDRTYFDQMIDRTALASDQLRTALESNNVSAARLTLKNLDKLRRQAHAELSY